MIVALFNVYLVILFLLVKLNIIRFTLFWKISPAIVLVLLLFGLFIPMGWGAPQGAAVVARNSVPIVPNVAGQVIDVPVEGNKPLKAGDVLFTIDPTPFKTQVDALTAQVNFEKLRLSQMTQLQSTQTGRAFDVQERQASVDQLTAQLAGYVTNLGLRKGDRVASLPLSPVMAFIDVSDTIVGVEIQQIDARYVQPGQNVELTFKFMPGKILTGKVLEVLQALSTGQVQASGTAVQPRQLEAAPFVVRAKLDDPELGRRLPAGAVGTAAIFTSHIRPSHIIRRVILRQIAILNYINPF
jgi:multidrug resistance efflux pump